jgi:hypothetical protein
MQNDESTLLTLGQPLRSLASKLVTPGKTFAAFSVGSKPDTSTNTDHTIGISAPKDSAATELVKPLTVVQPIVTRLKSADAEDYTFLS